MPLSDIRQGTFNEPDAGCVAAAAQHNEMWVRVRRYASPRINTCNTYAPISLVMPLSMGGHVGWLAGKTVAMNMLIAFTLIWVLY
jgi:hypothetical protein